MILLQRYISSQENIPGIFAGEGASATCLAIPSAKRPGSVSLVHYRVDERCDFVRFNGWWLYVATPVGLECYPELAALIAKAPSLGLQATLDQMEDLRMVAFVAYCETSERAFFGRSLDGFCSLFFGGHGARLIVCDDRLEVAQLRGEVELSRADEDEWSEYARLTPEGSFFEGVKRCFAGVRYCSDADDRGVPCRHLMAPHANTLNQADSVQLLQDGLLFAFSSYGDRRIALRLSGGIDSRVLLVGLLEAVKRGILRKDQILCLSVFFPGLECDESAEIREITRLADIELVGITATPENVEAAYNECLQLPGPQYPTSFMGSLCLQAAKQREVQIMISGHGGDEIFDYDLTDLLNLPALERFRRIRQIRMLRNKLGVVDATKALVAAVRGGGALRSVHKDVQRYVFSSSFTQLHRCGRRLGLAKGCGYELYACAAESAQMLIDLPFLRGPFWSRLMPCQWDENEFKAAAVHYMERYAPKIAFVPLQKRFFNDALRTLLPSGRSKCELVDDHELMMHASATAFNNWRANLRVPSSGDPSR